MSRSASLKNVIRLIGSANEETPVEKDFLNDLKRSIEITSDKGRRLPSKTYKPSSMNCTRQMVYQVLGKPQDESSSSYTLVGIAQSGTDIHERLQKAVAQMKENGIDCEYVDVGKYVVDHDLDVHVVMKSGMETKLYSPKYNMSFLCDGIIRYKGHYYVLELKTEISHKFFGRQGVDPSHYNQATAYSLIFGLDVIFVYVSRDTLDMKSYLYSVSTEMKQALVEKIEYCQSYADKGEIPPKPEDVAKKTCSYCLYRGFCSKDA